LIPETDKNIYFLKRKGKMVEQLLKISNLNLYVKGKSGERKILDNLNLEVFPSEIIAVVGRSGAGKTMLAKTLLRLNNSRIFRTEGEIQFFGMNILKLSNRQMLDIRGENISIVFQEPVSFLDPTMKAGALASEPLIKHFGFSRDQALKNIEQILEQFGVKDVRTCMNQYPYQLSGGLAQRIMIAAAMSVKPKILIADEPTSALDMLSQAAIVKLIRNLSKELGMAVIFITHDMELAHSVADRIAVMSNGTIVETGDTMSVFKKPGSEAAKKLLGSMIDSQPIRNISSYSSNDNDAGGRVPLMIISELYKYYRNKAGGITKAVKGISLEIIRGETFGILGESGCGKSTLAKLLTRLIKPDYGKILFNNTEIRKLKNYSRMVQMVFQDPLSSLDPRMRVENIIGEGLDINGLCIKKERTSLIKEYAQKVGFDSDILNRYPHELSGGQRQRVSIARALIMRPEMLILDEPTSYLDTVTQSQILDLFLEIKKELNMTYVFVTHNIKVIGKMCDRVAVMLKGRIVELGSVEEILGNPIHPLTLRFAGKGRENYAKKENSNYVAINKNVNYKSNNRGCCPYCQYCPKARDWCFMEEPGMLKVENSHYVACHFSHYKE
jgi:peptide/nickel transport system ATP-binding protein